jgi:site-specific recombinase XerD
VDRSIASNSRCSGSSSRGAAWRSGAVAPMPASPETVAAFLAGEADRDLHPVTITKRAAAIAAAHRSQGHPSLCDGPAIAAVLAGIRRTRGMRPQRKVQALELEPLARMVGLIESGTLAGLRDRALLLLGFAAALRRSELVALDAEDLCFHGVRGVLVTVRGSKTDQQRRGELVAVRYAQDPGRCAVRSVRDYIAAIGIDSGPVFRQMRRGDHLTDRRLSDQSVALIVKRRAEAAGISAALLSGHSLRAGYATAAAAAGVEERKIANVTRHRSLPVLRGYIRTAIAFDDVGDVL